MILVERHIIKNSDSRFKELDMLCFKSKNLYNACVYSTRQYYFKEKKFKNYYENQKEFQNSNNIDYRALPSKVSQRVLKMVEQNFKSFFAHLKKPKKGDVIRVPKYLDKYKGRFVVEYTIQAISKKELRNGNIKLSGCSSIIKTKQTNIQQVRVVPKGNHIVVEVLYKVDDIELKGDNGRYCSIDLGINNLATIGSNVLKPVIINGKPLKSINQYFNKKRSHLQSKSIKTTNRIWKLTQKRNNKVDDYLHKSSREIVNHLVSNNINTLIVGYNKGWKQDINIGKVNNQKFVQIPHAKFISMLRYKCNLKGITVIENEESYTSKCSFLDNEEVRKHTSYKGKRIKRGLFKSKERRLINADLNGALNILKKVVGEFQYPIEVCSTPLVLTIK